MHDHKAHPKLPGRSPSEIYLLAGPKLARQEGIIYGFETPKLPGRFQQDCAANELDG